MIRGKITRGVGGHYTVMTADGEFTCHARGLFRKHEITPLVGDLVEISTEGYLLEIMPRKNELNRPKIANIDQVIVTCSVRPAVNFHMLDAFLISCEVQDVPAVLCVNKIDLDPEGSHKEILKMYESAKYRTIAVSAQTKEGLEGLTDILAGKTSIFAGASGVGKSSILNALYPELALATGGLSEKIGRGKHTTRHTQLVQVGEGTYVVDSPGFTSVKVDHIPRRKLQDYYPEFDGHKNECYYVKCIHITEHDCAVQDQVGESIHPARYEQYKNFIQLTKE
ncbi:MAG: ribosome small subunit-dependent GTPase A [Defluviitaleaceae bacterium]|nr:ribosome small subunit-dependent GTPase A [Defluviitaleaceae bacterium]